ncbi:putative protein kinase [Leptomonas pyrrhocoris]|uniref:Protein kinase domain-containing protein n=1 Tax=Leptomonas pyrrhocoris TaxID=157538 RepID=A0A0N0DSI7_LEPPY|nr:putative protein kinase [Leptomonas pyrrhocoris]KPA76138.1 putative protein kinase [Leptomonas pyrrhocoris]|eukprot:XP_015654577.1 putative protein kinase [Leptomonas pyrrhocoris]
MTTAADLLSAPVTERGGTTASSTKGGTAVDTATTPSPTDEAVTRSEAAEVEDEVEDLGDDKVDADVDADVEDEGDTKGREGTAESLAATETSREDEDDSEVDVSADISGNSDEEGSEEDYSDEESESATDDEDEEYEEEEDEDSDEDEEESDAEPSSTHRRGQRRRSTSSPASRVAVGGGVAAAVAIRAKDKSTPGKPADEGGEDPPFLTKRSNTIVTAKPHHRNSNGKRRKKKDCVEAPRSICTKVSREGDVNVKVVYAVRTRHCFKRFVKEIMTRFSFAKSTDFDMYCIDATGDRVDIDIEEDFEQLLDAFEAAMVRTQEAQNTPTLPQFSTPAGLTEGPRGGYSANASLEERQGKPTSPATAAPRSLLASQLQNSHDGATAGGSFGSAWDYGGSSHPLGTEAEYGSPCGSTSTSGTQKQQLPGSLSPSSGFGASTSVVGGGMENDGKSSASVLRLYVRYSNAYYLVHGYPERPCSPSASPSLFASSNPPGRTTDPNVAALFTNQLQQLSALRPPSDDERRSADQLNALSNGGNGTHAGNGCSYDDSPIVHTLLGSMTGSATGPTALLLPHGSRGKVNEGTSHFFNGLGGTVGGGLYGAGASVRSSHFTGTGVELPSAQNSSFAMLTETQRDAFTCTFMVDGSALVEWRPVSVLGKGSFGTVYEGITLDGKMIAVKVQELPMDDDAAEIKALQTEINLMRSLKHRNIVAYYGCQTRVATTGGQQMEIFLELCHGGSLATLRRKLMKTQHVFAISLVRSYTRQVLHGLAYLHAQHVIHRDIKSDNVLISATGEAKLADFGCSKRFGGGTVQASPATLPFSTSPAPAPPVAAPAAMYQTMVGSPFFMAPEVLREDEGGYTSAADIWSVGCLVIELLGREPWEVTGTNIFQMMFRIAREQGMPTGVPPNCPAMLRSFFERCFERDPAKRATAAELLEHEWMTCPDKLLEEVPTDSVAG